MLRADSFLLKLVVLLPHKYIDGQACPKVWHGHGPWQTLRISHSILIVPQSLHASQREDHFVTLLCLQSLRDVYNACHGGLVSSRGLFA